MNKSRPLDKPGSHDHLLLQFKSNIEYNQISEKLEFSAYGTYSLSHITKSQERKFLQERMVNMHSPISILVLFALYFVVICEGVFVPPGVEVTWNSDYYPNLESNYTLHNALEFFGTYTDRILSFTCDIRIPTDLEESKCYPGVYIMLREKDTGNYVAYCGSGRFTYKSKSSYVYGIVRATDVTLEMLDRQAFRCIVRSISDSSTETPPSETEAPTTEPESTTSETEATTSAPEATTSEPEIPSSSSCECGKPSATRIVGGQEAEECKYFYQAGLFVDYGNGYTSHVFCGASIISSTVILTAAHCVFNNDQMAPSDPSNLIVKVGDYDYTNGYDENEKSHRVKNIIVHEDYIPSLIRNDIALIILNDPIVFNYCVAPICLPFPSSSYGTSGVDVQIKQSGVYLTASGWGRLYTGGPQPKILQEVTVPTISFYQCSITYGYYEGFQIIQRETMICAGAAGYGVCNGDSGGPLKYELTTKDVKVQVGIVSFGSSAGCAFGDYAGVYTNVQAFIPWIDTQLEEHNITMPCGDY